MRILLWVILASFLLYNAAILPSAINGQFPTMDSYMDGLLFLTIPFFALLLAAIAGLPRPFVHACAGLGVLFLLLATLLVVTNQAMYVLPALFMLFGAFCIFVLVGTLAIRAVMAITIVFK